VTADPRAAIAAHTKGVTVRVRLTPAGGADRIEGWAQDASGQEYLKARVRSGPQDGAANASLCGLLSTAIRVPKSAVQVISGAKARVKTVLIEGLDAASLTSALPNADTPATG
jgi:uncharacterized protein